MVVYMKPLGPLGTFNHYIKAQSLKAYSLIKGYWVLWVPAGLKHVLLL